MGLQSALTTSLTGLQAAETTIDVVGNNVANSNTVGFKESNTIFATQFLQTISIGSAPNTNSGGTNPRQIGLGVKVSQISPDFTQGTIEISSNPLDLAIQGDGFLIVQGNQGEQLFTRNGQLNLNSLNELTTTTGQRVLGYGVNDEFGVVTDSLVPLTIPLGQERVAQATETAFLQGVLNPAVTVGTQPSVSRSATLGNAAIEQPDASNFDLADLFVSEAPSPGDPPTTSVTAAAGFGGGDYTYRVAFLDSDGNEGAFSSAFSITGHTAGQAIDLANLPVADGVNFVDRVLYRTQAGGTDLFQVGNIGDATTTTFTDSTLDGALGTAADAATVDEGVYNYYVTYVNPSSGAETRPTERVGSISVTEVGGSRIRLNLGDLAPPTDTNFTQMRIYRNVAGTSEYYRLPTGTLAAPTATTPATAFIDTVDNATLGAQPELNFDGPNANTSTLLTNLLLLNGDTYENVFQEGTLTFDAEVDGVDLATKEFEVTATSNVQDLLDFLEGALGIDTQSDIPDVPFTSTGGVSIENGQIVVTSNLGEENAIEIPLTAFNITPTGSAITEPVTLPFGETQTAVGPGTSTELVVYDSLGLPLNVRVTTVLESQTGSSTTYRWYASSASNEPNTGVSTVVGDGLLTFNSNGELIDGPTNRISIQRTMTASASPLEVELNFDGVSSLGQTDAQGDLISTLNFSSQDGFPPGVLTDFIITEDGLIQGQFNNGVQRTLGQLVMARFANNQGLQQIGDSLFARSVNSGEPIFATAGAEGIGTLTAGAVELSNTDIGQNLIELILASTQYRGGARVITTSQELLDELLALRR